MEKETGTVWITPKGNFFFAPEELTSEEYDKVVIELFGEDELKGDEE